MPMEPLDVNRKIREEQTHVFDVKDNYNYMPLEKENIYVFMDNAYHGTGGFRDGTYLVPHSREISYDARRDFAFYKNFVGPIVQAMVDPVFNEPITRTVETSPLAQGMVDGFIKNCDAAGTSFDEFMRDVMISARLHGVTFIVVDNYTANEIPETIAESEAKRLYPYAYQRLASEVDCFEADKIGNLVSITFIDDPVKVKSENGVEEVHKRFTKWDKVALTEIGEDKNKQRYVVGQVIHGLGVVPVIPVYMAKKKKPKNIFVDPPLYDIAKLNHAIFNKDSEIRDQERAQGFSIFYVQSDSPGEANIGTHNIWWLPMGTTIPPGFAAPDAAILSGLVANNNALKEDLFKIAGQNGVIGVTSASSGLAMQWDFKAQEIVLKKTAIVSAGTESKIIEVFSKYIKTPIEYNVTYTNDFQPNSVQNELEAVDKLNLMDMPEPVKMALKKYAFRLYMGKKMTKEELDELLEFFDDEDMESVIEEEEIVNEEPVIEAGEEKPASTEMLNGEEVKPATEEE